MEDIVKFLNSTLTEDPKKRYWRRKQQKMTRCTGCGRRSRQEARCCSSLYIHQTGSVLMISPANGRQVPAPYHKTR